MKNNYPTYNYFFGTVIDYKKLIELQANTVPNERILDKKTVLSEQCKGEKVRTRSYVKKRESK